VILAEGSTVDAGYIGTIIGTAAILIVGYFLNRRVKKVQEKTVSIDKAVNSRPETDPKLYDIAVAGQAEAADVNRKLDGLVSEIRSSFEGVNRRLNNQDDRMNQTDRAGEGWKREVRNIMGAQAEGIQKLSQRLDRAGVPRVD
jgi:small-conductance mechanosensitive channel